MDLQIGAHCSLPSCNVLDFLPITCPCNKSFCSTHISPELHQCPLLDQPTLDSISGSSSSKLLRCAFMGCSKLALESRGREGNETCAACRQYFCVEHRFPDAHDCASTRTKATLPVRPTRPAVTSRLPTRKPPSDPVKFLQWQKVEIMKMRHRASPGDPKDKSSSLPPEQRLHVKIVSENKENVFWFRKDVVTGRALDLLVSQLKLFFPKTQVLELRAVKESGEESSLANDRLLSEQIEDGTLVVISPVLH